MMSIGQIQIIHSAHDMCDSFRGENGKYVAQLIIDDLSTQERINLCSEFIDKIIHSGYKIEGMQMSESYGDSCMDVYTNIPIKIIESFYPDQ
jgi:hypothetical protein